jgi:hypothetical protein
MSCLPSGSKCEWSDLKHFVAELNLREESDYSRTSCLDLCSDVKQPEVLCTSSVGKKLVIERKAVIWPAEYAEKHRAEHRFFDFICQKFKPVLDATSAYELQISPPDLISDKLLTKHVEKIYAAIFPRLAEVERGIVISELSPLAFRFQKQPSSERSLDEPCAGLAIVTIEKEVPLLDNQGRMEESFCQHLQQLINTASLKFTDYQSVRRILVIQPFSSSLYAAMLDVGADMLDSLNIPSMIEEIWMIFHIENDAWSFTRLLPSESLPPLKLPKIAFDSVLKPHP